MLLWRQQPSRLPWKKKRKQAKERVLASATRLASERKHGRAKPLVKQQANELGLPRANERGWTRATAMQLLPWQGQLARPAPPGRRGPR